MTYVIRILAVSRLATKCILMLNDDVLYIMDYVKLFSSAWQVLALSEEMYRE